MDKNEHYRMVIKIPFCLGIAKLFWLRKKIKEECIIVCVCVYIYLDFGFNG